MTPPLEDDALEALAPEGLDDADYWEPDPEPPPDAGPENDPERPTVRGFEWKAKGLFKAGTPDRVAPGSESIVPGKNPEWIAPPFRLRGLVRDEASQGWGLIMAWADPDGVPHEEVIPADLLTGDGAELAKRLGNGGLFLPAEPGKRRHLLRYLVASVSHVPRRVRQVDATGWHRGAFVMPDGAVIGQAQGEPVCFAGPRGAMVRKPTGGTLEGWQSEVAAQAVGEPFLAFAVSVAFAGPVMGMVRPDAGGGFNLQGFSSKGKSTVLECAASVWHTPHPLPTWRATSNGLEGIAASRNDGFLPLDELGQVDTREAGQTAYLLANGADKVRARREGGNREARTWRLIFLSSGEVGLEDRLNEDGRKAKAGQSVRVPDIPCPSSGMFMDAHGHPSTGAFAEALKRAAREHYGHAARRFLVCLCEEWSRRDELARKLKAMEAEWMARTIPGGVDPQVRRVGGRFALVAVAGELAREMGILPWPEGEASRAAAHCFRAWLDRRGHASSSETVRAVQAVIDFLGKHGASRFEPWGEADTKTINRAGWRKRSEGVDGFDFFLTSEGWKEATAGLNPRDAARASIEAGILEPDPEGKASRSLSIPSHGKARVYVIRARGLAQLQEGEAA